jgi:hypothetical protein
MATLIELLTVLKDNSSILVTGPQRWGTTISARILASELARQHADEDLSDVLNANLRHRCRQAEMLRSRRWHPVTSVPR